MEPPNVERVQLAVGDQYDVERLFARGGMGAVYLAQHRRLGSQVAIKVLPVPASEGSDELARFAREARLSANLPHPNNAFNFAIRNIHPKYMLEIPFIRQKEDLIFLRFSRSSRNGNPSDI